MAIDSSIALQGANPLKMIGDLQSLDRQRMENQKYKATMAADIAKNQAESDVATGTVHPRISQQESAAGESKVGLGEHYQKLISGVTSQIAADPTVQAASKPGATKEDKDKASRRASDLLHIGIGGATVMGVPQDVIKGHIQPILDVAEHNPEDLYQVAANHQIQSMTPSERTANVFPAASTLNTGSQILPVQGGNQAFTGKAPLSQVGAPINQTISPGQQYEPTGHVDQNNQPIYRLKNLQGGVIGETTVPNVANPSVANPQAGQGAAPFRLPAGETQETANLAKAVQFKSNQNATFAKPSIFNSNQIIKLADESFTGKGAQTLANLGGQYAVIGGLFGSGKTADAYNQLGHYMSLQTATLAQGAGLGTDAGRAVAEGMAGKTEWTADAIKATARVNRALATGSLVYDQGINNAVKNAGGSPFAARDFQQKWSQVADVDSLRLYDALKNKDDSGLSQIVREMGGKGSAKFKSALENVDKMGALIKGNQ